MTGYLMHIIFYTMAMIGIILVGFIIAKKSLTGLYTQNPKNKFLSIENYISIEPRKNIYVLKAGTERFLISTNSDQTQLLTKLDPDNILCEESYSTEQEKIAVPASISQITEKLNRLVAPLNNKR